MVDRQQYLFGEPREHEIRMHRQPDVEQVQQATDIEARQLLLPGMEDINEPPLSEEIATLLRGIDSMNAYEIAREFHRLKIEHQYNIFPELSQLMNQRGKGFLILLNLVRLDKIHTDGARQAIAEKTYQRLKAGNMNPLELAEVVESLDVPAQPGRGKYKKMNGLISTFKTTISQFHSFVQGSMPYWKEVLPFLASGEATDCTTARRLHSQGSSGLLQQYLKSQSAHVKV